MLRFSNYEFEGVFDFDFDPCNRRGFERVYEYKINAVPALEKVFQ